MINWRGVIGSAAMLLMIGTASADPAKPMDPGNAILEAFKTHDVVALGEGSHGNEQAAAFRMTLYRDPRFRAVARDIVVECGNGRHQAMMDRYLPDGKMVTQDVGEAIGGTMQDRFDALIYLGPSAAITYSKTPKALCADPDYVEMRAARLAVMRSFGDAPSPADEFRAWCKAIADAP